MPIGVAVSVELNTVLKCSRPIYFENKGEEKYTYSVRGSAFIIYYQDDYYVFTAEHNLKDFESEDISIFISETSRYFIPINNRWKVIHPQISESDYADISLLRVDKKQLNKEELNSLKAIDLDMKINARVTHSIGDGLILSGYPTDNREIDYEEAKLLQQRVIIEGEYDGISYDKHIHRINVQELGEATTFDGLSGSPVFRLDDAKNNKYDVNLVGLILRGGFKARKLYYVDTIVLYNMLNKI